MIKKILIPFFLLWLSFSGTFAHPYPEQHFGSGATLNLSKQDLTKPVALHGEWMFYWKQLLVPSDFVSGGLPAGGLPVHVPSYWTRYTDREGEPLSSTGYATYFLRIILPPNFSDTIGLSVPVFDSSYDLYINGKLQGGSGKVGRSRESSRPGYRPFQDYFVPHSDTLNIVVHVSNFRHRRGGFWKTMLIGRDDVIRGRAHLNEMIIYMTLGILIAFFLFFLAFYLLYRNNKTLLYFAIVIAGGFIRLSFTNLYPLQTVFHTSWLWQIRFEYLGTFLAFCFGMWYLYSLYPNKGMRKFTLVNTYLTGLVFFLILFTIPGIFTWSLIYMEPVLLFVLLYYLAISFRMMTRAMERNAPYFVALLFLFLAFINDVLLASSRPALSGEYILHFSVMFFIFVQAYMIIRRWVRLYTEKEKLLQEVRFVNTNLENLVNERTREIDERNSEIERQNLRYAAKNEELQREISFKNRIFSIIAHDLRDPLSTINMYLEMAEMNQSFTNRKDIVESASTIARSASNLVENLLYWGRSQDKQLVLTPRECDMQSLVTESFSLLGESARRKGVELEMVMDDGMKAVCDRDIMLIVFRNLISNAIKFSRKGEKVIVSVRDEKDRVVMVFEDHGVGMSEPQLKNILSGDRMVSTYGTNHEKGTGLGLKLCNDLVKLHGGEMEVFSRSGEGTRVRVILPKNDESKS